MDDKARGRVLYTPTSPTSDAPRDRSSRSPTRRRANSRTSRRSRHRSTRRSRGRNSRCSPGQDSHRQHERCSRRSRSRVTGHRQSHVSSQASRHRVRERAASPQPTRDRSRSQLRRRSRSQLAEQLRSQRDSQLRSQRSRQSRSQRSRQSRSQRSRQSRRSTSRGPRRSRSGKRRTRSRSQRQSKNVGEPLMNSSIADLAAALKLLSNNNSSLEKLGSMNNTIPEFDPNKKEQTMTMWLHKVNECASIYGWTEKQVVHFALPKLKGAAQRWYEGQPSVLFSWVEWQEMLLENFPSEENYGNMLTDMLAKRARFSDSLEEYYYEKVALLNRCGILGKRAVECIIHGIDDRSVRLGAEAAQYAEPNKLLPYLRNARNIKPNTERRFNKNVPSKGQEGHVRMNLRPMRCSNCKKDGHVTSQCTQPLKKCGRCSRIGHDTDQCYAKLPNDKTIAPNEKTTMRVTGNNNNMKSKIQSSGQTPNDKYFKSALVNGKPTECYIDFGSECSMIGLSEFNRLFHNDRFSKPDSSELPVLRGFGNSMVQPIGKRNIKVAIDGVEANVDLLIVPDCVMPFKLLIGQTYTEQPHIAIAKTSSHLDIVQLDQLAAVSSKIRLYCDSDSKVSGSTFVEVRTDPVYEGDVFVEGGHRSLNGVNYSLTTGVFRIEVGGVGQIAAHCLPHSSCTLKKDFLIARGRVANEEKNVHVRNVIESAQGEGKPLKITDSDLRCDTNLPCRDRDQLLSLLNRYRSCFAFDLTELGKTSVGEMSIQLQDDEPVVYRPYRLAVAEKEKVRDMISELLDNNIIRPSTSPYASPIVVVRKKTGELRLCIDFRALNKKTVKENYPMPLIDDQLDVLAGNQFYTTLDLASGYYQIPIREEDKHKTGFVTPDGHYEFNRMPFGLANAPATFQRLMHQVLGSARHREALAYLDDVIIPSKDITEGMTRLETILDLFCRAGLTLKLSKCFFFGQAVEYLGFEVSKDGIRPGSRKIEAVKNFPVPENQHNIRQFLGLSSFFRRFVPNFSVITKPLTQLLKKDAKWLWGPDQETAFRTLQRELAQKPTLALYDPQATTELHTDACKVGVAGILLQKNEDGILKPVAYFSRQTTPEEQNYSSYDLETLAVVASLHKFRVYLIGIAFKIVTDCNSLRATFQKRDMLPRVARWWEQMQEYNFNIEYRPGTAMAHVDALSRNPVPSLSLKTQSSRNVFLGTDSDWLTTVQNADSEVQRIIGILKDPELDNVIDIKSNYKLKNHKLFRITAEGDRWVVPKGVRWQIVKQNHDDIGHFGVDKTLEKIRASYWFPKMRTFVSKYVTSCLECAFSKASAGKKPGYLHPIEKVDTPFDTVHADHVGPFVRSSRGNVYILVIIDSFTKYIYLKPVRNTKTQTSIKTFREYFGIFSVPRRIITDRGTSFTSDAFKNFLSEKNIKHVLNAVSTPRANGQVERYNKTLLDALTAKCIGSAENKWDDHLPDVQWGLNNTFNKGINRTPSEALFGIRLVGPSESCVFAELTDDITSTECRDLDEIRDDINTHVKASQEAQKLYYDSKRCSPRKYKIGDLVRVERQVPTTGNSKKLVPKFQGPYRITKIYDFDRFQIEDTPMTQKGNKRYSTIVAIDKIRPWLNYARPHDISSGKDDEQVATD